MFFPIFRQNQRDVLSPTLSNTISWSNLLEEELWKKKKKWRDWVYL